MELVPDQENLELLEKLEDITIEYADLSVRANDPWKCICFRCNFFGLYYRNLFHTYSQAE